MNSRSDYSALTANITPGVAPNRRVAELAGTATYDAYDSAVGR